MAISTTMEQDESFADLVSTRSTIRVEIDATIILQWVEVHFAPEDVFDKDALSRWALENGFVPDSV